MKTALERQISHVMALEWAIYEFSHELRLFKYHQRLQTLFSLLPLDRQYCSIQLFPAGHQTVELLRHLTETPPNPSALEQL